MIAFLIKSTLCLIVFYIFYHFFLKDQKILLFNRFYLNISLILSVSIPLINIPVKSSFNINDSIEKFNFQIENESAISLPSQVSSGQIPFLKILVVFFIVISLILLIRFILNITRIYLKIYNSKKVQYNKTTVVLINERILPYSFFKYIFVYRTDFEKDNIEQELLLHEEAHCEQFHSIDIIVVELLNIILWFNPAIWMIRKEILLNHEYLADSMVLTTKDSNDYQRLLINVLLQNNANYLVNNFEYSSIKNRMIMITKSNPSNNAIFRKATGIIVFLLIGIISCTTTKVMTHIPDSNSYVGIWQLSKGLMHGSAETNGMFTVNNPDGTFYMYTTSGRDSLKASILQYGTYEMTSDSTCNVKILQHPTNPNMIGKTIFIKYRFIDTNTLYSQWKLDNFAWMPELWQRVK